MDIRPFGETAFQVVLGDATDPGTLRRVHALARLVGERRAAGDPWGAAVPGITTLLVPFDPHAWDAREARRRLAQLTERPAPGPEPGPPATHRIPVRYGGAHGPDLVHVAGRLGIAPEAVVRLHAATTFQVAILGFMPGFGYLCDLPEALRLPRRSTPRTRVPAGSVAIAGRYTAVYPATTPGGWHLIGSTDVRLWDIEAEPPALLRPGDLVRFTEID
jgi:KipI family sensor histidine kinase inhibitor